MQHFIEMINSLQLIIHLPIMNIIMPANVSTFFQAIVAIVNFDILSDFGIIEMMFNFDDEQQDYNNIFMLDQMEDLGYDSHNAIVILGTMGVLLF
jgi:hypothetical protein